MTACFVTGYDIATLLVLLHGLGILHELGETVGVGVLMLSLVFFFFFFLVNLRKSLPPLGWNRAGFRSFIPSLLARCVLVLDCLLAFAQLRVDLANKKKKQDGHVKYLGASLYCAASSLADVMPHIMEWSHAGWM